MYKFPLQMIAIASALVLSVMPMLSSGAAYGKDYGGKNYQCTAKDAVGIQPDGTLAKNDPGANLSREHFDQMVINLETGSITYPTSGTRETRAVQRTTVADDYVLIPSLYFQRKKGAANATTDFIFVRIATGTSQATFSAFRQSYLVTGTCMLLE